MIVLWKSAAPLFAKKSILPGESPRYFRASVTFHRGTQAPQRSASDDMPLPIAHGFIGATTVCLVARSSVEKNPTRTLVTGALLAISPDLDFLFEWVLGWQGIHRTVTHSLIFAAMVSLVLFWRVGEQRGASG